MKKSFFFSIFAILTMISGSWNVAAQKYTYESVPNDPLNARIYTLSNGMKVYLSVNKDQPRIQAYVVVKVGGKNDPAETTGLAHYFEHLMFKGTSQFGTSDFEAEKPYLDEIEQLFEVYRVNRDTLQRKAIYAQIDSVSQLASKIAIPNEYDKLMSSIGSSGTNAFTSYDVTAYTENIPSNEVENWAKIQYDRFIDPVIRGFHTELETVYEEFNMSLTRDGRRVNDTIMAALFPSHPYGIQTVLGKGEHLKNPSITNIKNYFDTYYLPNNIAICMAGDLDPDATMDILTRYFGKMKPKPVPALQFEPEQEITQPIRKEVIGLEAENVSIAFRGPAANNPDMLKISLIDYMLANGKAGLIDLNIVQKQKALRAGCGVNELADYSAFQLYGYPKEGQSLDEVRDLLLSQIELIKKGEFDEELLRGIINNFRLDKYYQQQEPRYAVSMFLDAFISNKNWKDVVDLVDNLEKLTKKDIVDFSNQFFKDNYVVVYKIKGTPDLPKIEKPAITPIAANRDMESEFLKKIRLTKVKPIEPVFLDFEKDLKKLSAKNQVEVLYIQNKTNPLFSLYYVFDMGNNNDKALGTAFNYLNYLGTSTKTAEEIKSELYQLACSFGVSATEDRVYVSVNGLGDNFDKAMALLEDRLADVQVDPKTYDNLVNDMLKSRANAKLSQGSIFYMLANYAQWGPNSARTNILSETELKSMNPEELTNRIKDLKNYQHRIMYYGPLTETQLLDAINKNHAMADQLQPVPAPVKFTEQPTDENAVLLAHYDAKQVYMQMISKGVPFDKNIESIREMYNNYFGSGMSGIVFQEMREARGLAYSAYANYERPGKPDRSYYMGAFIATQNDKVKDAVDAFNSIINDMPESEKAFDIAKESIMTNLRTQRVLRENILWNYLGSQEFGYQTDQRIELFEKIPQMKLADVKAFQEEYVKGKSYKYCILGDTNDSNLMNVLPSFGKVAKLTLEEIFGY
ncbi:MAG: insulinase family protein [Dysgonamonadaceae bacterium]|jgi:predicted Zn-dependent peptidase|nr:insulinase family protein [Dysgonamonadaceae bacterium]